ncbi:MAG: hypothetical protein FWE11_04740 [Defluviitaleaceae bacterium]|nr:hypothetical protein [Defluviitaleaceae bacterium]
MKITKPVLLLILATLALAITACSNDFNQGRPTPIPNTTPPSTSEEEENVPEEYEVEEAYIEEFTATEELPSYTPASEMPSDPLLINAIWATSDILNNFDAFESLTDYDQGTQRIVIISGIVITNARYIAISLNESNLSFNESAVIHTLDELLPERPFVINWQEENPPHRGISFTDANNRPRYFYITTDISDGHVILVEFQPGVSMASG